MSENQYILNSKKENKQPYKIIKNEVANLYEQKVSDTYCEDPEHWKKAIGNSLLFQFGIYDNSIPIKPFFSKISPTASLDESSVRYFEQQLFLAGLTGSDRPIMNRILDIGCGWGYILKYLSESYPECNRLDGVNISEQQLDYCANYHRENGLNEKINLFLCNAQDINLLPNPEVLYDLVIIRGVISHFPNNLFETTMKSLLHRVRPGGKVIISDNLYHIEDEQYQSAIPDITDRLACKHIKTPSYIESVLKQSGFTIKDFRVLPSNLDVIQWLMNSKENIERHFPNGTQGALEELRVLAENWSIALLKNKVSTYSIIITK